MTRKFPEKFLALTLASACLWPMASWAQTSPLIIDRNRSDRTAPAVPKRSHRIPVPTEKPGASFAPFELKAVQVEGASVSPVLLEAATRPYIGKQIDAAAAAQLAQSVATAYDDNADIALYTVVLPEQDFSGGVLKLRVVEGYIAHVDIHGDVKGDTALVQAYATKLTTERPLTKSTFQRYISLIRDVAGLEPDIQLNKGDAPGAVMMSLGLDQKDSQFVFSIGTGGARELGRIQLGASETFYHLFQEGDATTFAVSFPTDFKRYQYFSFSETQPLNDDGLIGQVNAGYLRTRPKGAAPHGDAQTLQFLLSYPLLRSYDENLYVSLSADALNSKNALLGEIFANERTRALRTGLSYTHSWKEDSLAAGATLSFGIDGLGARVSDPAFASSDFQKVNLQAAFSHAFDNQFSAKIRAIAQYTGARLPTSEFFALGGTDFGRGFAAASIAGDRGIAGSVEAAYRPEKFPIDYLQGSEVYAFYDVGRTTFSNRPLLVQRSFDLASVGAGLRLTIGKKWGLFVEAQKPVQRPTPFFDDGLQFGFGINARY